MFLEIGLTAQRDDKFVKMKNDNKSSEKREGNLAAEPICVTLGTWPLVFITVRVVLDLRPFV